MKRWSGIAILAALLMAALPMLAQRDLQNSGTGPNGQGYGSNYIPDGARFVVVLDNKLDSDKLESGKGFKAHLGEDLTAPNGDVIPLGSKVKGHVSSADNGFHGRLLLSFDSIETRHGWVPLSATVTDVPGEHGMKTSNEGEVENTTNSQRTVETAAAGAAVGAGTGAIAGGGHGALIGAAVGGAVGGTAGLLTGRNVHLNKGQQLELTLDRPLEVPAR
jgi:hypothetical protein